MRTTSTLTSVRGVVALFVLPALGLAGCVSSGAPPRPGDVPAPAVPAAPVKKPFEPPPWESSAYQNEDEGFSVHFPVDFAEQPPQGETGLFTAASPMQVPRIDVNRGPIVGAATPEEISSGVAESLELTGGGEATVKEVREVTLRDGVTPAVETVIDWAFQGFPLQSFVLAVVRGDSLITVMVTGMQGGEVSELSEIAYTLYFD